MIAELTDIAYRALLRQGLSRAFLDVELELWQEVGRVYRDKTTTTSTTNGDDET